MLELAEGKRGGECRPGGKQEGVWNFSEMRPLHFSALLASCLTVCSIGLEEGSLDKQLRTVRALIIPDF